jgi:hypothetical protein
MTGTTSTAERGIRTGARQRPAADGHNGFAAGLAEMRARMRGLGSGPDEIAAGAGRRDHRSQGAARRRSSRRAVAQAAAPSSAPRAAGVPGFWLVIGVEGDQRAWVPGRGYHVRTRFTVPVSGQARQDGGLTAVLPGGGPRHA